eukprot:892593-Pyramimonas_sp.AAC.1
MSLTIRTARLDQHPGGVTSLGCSFIEIAFFAVSPQTTKASPTLGYKCVVSKPPGTSHRPESRQDAARHARYAGFTLSAHR